MFKTSLKIVVALALAFVAYLFYQAANSAAMPAQVTEIVPAPTAPVLTIAFGSCNRQDKPQDYWQTISSHDPYVWLWLGDNVYSDTEDMEKMAADYARQKEAPQYAAFVQKTPLLYGIWDDHDYGVNDGGKEWPHKDAAKELMLDFLDVPATAAVRKHPGGYQSYLVEQAGLTVKVILLDTRYFRDPTMPPTRKGHRYGQHETGDVLGEEQWSWLEQELRGSTADAHLIASSIQVLPQEHGYEKWDLFPTARRRLLELLAETRPALLLLLSGDRHLAEISRVEENGFPIHEITASGLTHSYTGADEPNPYRISPLSGERNYGLLHYLSGPDGPQLLAEVHRLNDDKLLADLALTPTVPAPDKAALSTLIHDYDQMPNELKPCPQSPNCVSTQTDQAAKKRDPISFQGTAAAAKERLMKVVDNMKRTELQSATDNYLHYTFKTWPIPFVDDVEFLIDEEAKLIHFRSASRVGHSDLGVNSKRMAKIVAAFAGAE